MLIYFFITQQVVLVCVVNDETLITYNDNKLSLFSTYHPAKLCSINFLKFISFYFSQEPFEA